MDRAPGASVSRPARQSQVATYRPKPSWLTFPNAGAFAVAVALTGNLVGMLGAFGLALSAAAVVAVSVAASRRWRGLPRETGMAFALGTALEVLVVLLAPAEVAFIVGLGALVVLGAAAGHYLSRAIVARRDSRRKGRR